MAFLALTLTCLAGMGMVTAQQGTVKYVFEKVYVPWPGVQLVKNNAIAKYNYDTTEVPNLPYRDERDLHFQHCVAGCANKHYFGTHCNVVFVSDITDNGSALILSGDSTNECYHASLDLADLLAFQEEEDATKWAPATGTIPTQFKVKYLNIFDALHNP